MKRSLLVSILDLVLVISVLILSIGFDVVAIFFIGLALVLISNVVFINIEIRSHNKKIISCLQTNEYIEAIAFIESKKEKCFYKASKNSLLFSLCSLYLIVDRYSDAKSILDDTRNLNIKSFSYFRFVTSICDGDKATAELHLQTLNSIRSAAYSEQKLMADKILKMVISGITDKEVKEKTKFPCVARLCEQIEKGEYAVLKELASPQTKEQRTTLSKSWKIPSILLIIGSSVSIFIALMIVGALVSNSPIPEANVMPEFMWVFYLLTPITIASVIFGIVAKAKVKGCTANIIVGAIMTIILSIYGSFSLVDDFKVSHDVEYISVIENAVKIELPNDGHVVYQKGIASSLDTTYVRFNDKNEMLNCIASNSNWMTNLDKVSTNNIGLYDMSLTSSYHYFLVYDITCSSYNDNPSTHKGHEFYYLAYNETSNLLYTSHYYQN